MASQLDPPPAGQRNLHLVPINGAVYRTGGSQEDPERRALVLLRRLYFFRVASAIVWVSTLAALKSSNANALYTAPLITATLAVYPALDGLATLVDLRVLASVPVRRLLWANLVVGLTTAALLVLLAESLDSEIRIFGLWAIASGVTQLTLGAIRQTWLKRQWLMIISGAGSLIAGLTYASWVGSGPAGLSSLEQYSIGGAVWYLITAAWFLASSRSHLTPDAWLPRPPGAQR